MGAGTLEQVLIGLEPQCRRKESADRVAVEVLVEVLEAFMRRLRDDPRLAFDMLLDHTAIDHCEENRFELVYLLYSTTLGHSLMVTCDLDRSHPVAPTVGGIWPIAHWQEREVFDLFGVGYEGHPDLRRIFLEDGWQGHPLRKDYRDADMLEFGQ
jgi:NADH-quinone oxidoreductase subunit C